MIMVSLPKCGRFLIKTVQILDKFLSAAMKWARTEQPPVELAVFIPLTALAEFAAHEQQFFARKKPLITEQRTKIGKPLPVITGHPPQQRALAMYDLVVRQRQDEIFVVVIQHR